MKFLHQKIKMETVMVQYDWLLSLNSQSYHTITISVVVRTTQIAVHIHIDLETSRGKSCDIVIFK